MRVRGKAATSSLDAEESGKSNLLFRRDATLRGRSTLPMIEALARAGALSAGAADTLSGYYVFLRDVEHALQYVDDQQTQWLPREGETLERAAGLLGMEPSELWSKIERVREYVVKTFDGVFQVNAEKSEAKDADRWPTGWADGSPRAPEMLEKLLGDLGYGDSSGELASRILSLVSGRRALVLSEEARTRMRRLVQFVVEKCPEWIMRRSFTSILPQQPASAACLRQAAGAQTTSCVIPLCSMSSSIREVRKWTTSPRSTGAAGGRFSMSSSCPPKATRSGR